jgi:hypothetical protein
MCLATGKQTKSLDPDLKQAHQQATRQTSTKGQMVPLASTQQVAASQILAEQKRRDDLRAEMDNLSQARTAEMERVAQAQRDAEAKQQGFLAQQAEQKALAERRAAEQQAQMRAAAQAQAQQVAQQQDAQRQEIARQQAEQARLLSAQRLATGAASTSLRALNQKPAGSGPTAAVTGANVPGGEQKRRRGAGTGAGSLRIGSSGQSSGAGLNIGV